MDLITGYTSDDDVIKDSSSDIFTSSDSDSGGEASGEAITQDSTNTASTGKAKKRKSFKKRGPLDAISIRSDLTLSKLAVKGVLTKQVVSILMEQKGKPRTIHELTGILDTEAAGYRRFRLAINCINQQTRKKLTEGCDIAYIPPHNNCNHTDCHAICSTGPKHELRYYLSPKIQQQLISKAGDSKDGDGL